MKWLGMEHQKVFFDKAKLIDNFVKKARAFGCKVKEAIADTGYYSHRIFRYLAEQGIKPVIEFRKGAVITGSRVKDEVVREIGRDRERWKERN
ncbi:MAG: hypothetical protein RMK35_01845 [Aquificaceae bacterium]|nr:hypothetical protein [Aquificaceae bacterium]